MKVLHTADWHMNNYLGRIDRSQHICQALEQIAHYLEEYHVDVLVVAGDLLSDRSRPEQLRTAVGDIRRIFQPFLRRGGTMVVISGNHDSEVFFETLRDAMDLVGPGRVGQDGVHAAGCLYVAPRPRVLRLADATGKVVQFVLMPYPTARCYLRGEAVHYNTIDEKHRAIQQAFATALHQLQATLNLGLPSVLVSHVHVRGVQTRSLYRISEVEDVIFEASDIPTHWAYVAYGHVHQAQAALPNAHHVRYSGSIERFDASERDDDKSVVLCDIGPAGLVGEPVLLPLQSRPIYQIEITDPETQISGLREQYPDAERALVSYTLHWHPGKHDRDALCRAIHDVFPNVYDRAFREVGRTDDGPVRAHQLADPITTVRDYLQLRLATSEHRDAVLAAAEGLMSEGGWR
jgi:DNA repair protein SbcD/Mre11